MKSVMRDDKAIRAAELLRQYCSERGCADCVFWLQSGRFCTLMSVKVPASFPEMRKDKEDSDG